MERQILAAAAEKARSGEPQAMEHLLRYTYAFAHYECRKLLEDPEDASRVTGEVLQTVYRRLDLLDTPGAFLGWLNRTTARLCLREISRKGVQLDFAADWDSFPEGSDVQRRPEPELDNEMTARRVEAAVDALPLSQRVCVYLKYYDELGERELARMLGITEKTACSCLKEARQNLGRIRTDAGAWQSLLSPVPYLQYFLRRCAAAEAEPLAARSMARAVLYGELPPAAEPAPAPEPLPEYPEIPESAALAAVAKAERRKKKEEKLPVWFAVVAVLCAVAIGFGAAVIQAGGGFQDFINRVMATVMDYLF